MRIFKELFYSSHSTLSFNTLIITNPKFDKLLFNLTFYNLTYEFIV